jgi:hypothetical protein
MNWYCLQKKSQQQVETIEKTDIGGIDNPPPIDNSSNHDNNNFEPSRQMIDSIYKWIEEGNAQNISKLLIQTTLSKFEYKIHTNFKIETTPVFPLIIQGHCLLTFDHLLGFESVELSLLMQQIKNMLLQSNLWKYIKIPYESAFKYTQNEAFVEFVTRIIGFYTFDGEIKECAFWSYSESPKYINEIKKNIFNHLKKKFTNLDFDSIQVSFPAKPTCRGSCPENLGFYLSSYNYAEFTANIWKFEQKIEGNNFEKLDIHSQKEIVSYLNGVLESEWEGIYTRENEDIEISYNKRDDDLIIYPDNIVYFKNILEEESLKYLLEENLVNQSNIRSILESIPTELLDVIKHEGIYRVPIDEDNWTVGNVKIILRIREIKLQNNVIFIKILFNGEHL